MLIYPLLVGREPVEKRRSGVYEQSLFGSRHTHIIPTQHIVRQTTPIRKEHINVIKLTTFRLVDG